ncbi:hypothetical protein E4634_06305 [Mangrovimicrobium sediminis]|uniref:DUF4349 domain-containing protein n=1 Tax=Mangrovimicrobium sediminis TaxID=2562682 RepID=A0A4Z0M5W8_9GAMM|nr:hypothetical protein [Haliea sp. SAOS-164]TGD74807.1 hypothetical protein E4634_06305 [Haliea sp. SAOS-164]
MPDTDRLTRPAARLVRCLLFSLLFVLHGCAAQTPPRAAASAPAAPEVLIEVYTQSIGRGVPTAAREALLQVRREMLAQGLAPTETRWGIEGEQRLCVVVDAADQAALLAQIEQAIEGIDYIRVAHRALEPGESAATACKPGRAVPAP